MNETYNELAEMTVCPVRGPSAKGLRDKIEALNHRFFTLVTDNGVRGTNVGHTKTVASEEGRNLLELSAHLQADWRDWYGDEFPSTRWTGPDEFGTPCDS